MIVYLVASARFQRDIERMWLERSIERQDWHCHYCHRKMTRQNGYHLHTPPWWPTLDHIIPRVAGGPNSEENTVAACYECNHRKADMMPWDFMELIAPERERRMRYEEMYDQSVAKWRSEDDQACGE